MAVLPSRHRSLALLAGVLAAQVLLLAMQIKREQQVRLIRVWAVEGIAPLGRATAWVVDGLHGGWSGYIDLRHMRRENQDLHVEVDALKLRNASLESRAAEADRLGALLGFHETHADIPMLAARVIGASPDSGSRIMFLDRGSRDGVKRDMGVITPEGVVGKVLAVFPDTSQILLLSDKDSGVGALLASSRTQGPVRGSGDPMLGMEYVSNDVKIAPGEVVLTSGQDRIFPKDLPVGVVVNATPDSHGPFQQIVVRPAAHLDQLEEVLVLLSHQEFESTKTVEQPATAATSQKSVTSEKTATLEKSSLEKGVSQEKSALEKSTAAKPAPEKPTGEKLAAPKPLAEKPVTGKLTPEKPEGNVPPSASSPATAPPNTATDPEASASPAP